MGLFGSMADDLHSEAIRQQWMDLFISGIPGSLGFDIRRRIVGRRFRAVGTGLMIYPDVRIYGAGNLSVGNNCRFGSHTMLQANGEIEMGDDVLLGPDVKIWSVNHASALLDVPIFEQGYEHKKVVIGNGVWIGANAFVMPGAYIGDHCIVAAGSVVAGKAIEPYSVVAGNPARKIGSRLARPEDAVREIPSVA